MAAENGKHFPLILLAGGKSSRLGQPKGLIEISGRLWLEIQCDAFRTSAPASGGGGGEIILVLGFEKEAYDRSGVFERAHVSCVINSDPEHGPFTSIQAGARKALESACSGAFVLPIDVPVPAPEVWESLARELSSDVRVCQPTFEPGFEPGFKKEGRARGGHPVLLSREELQHLVKMDPASRLDQRIHELQPGELRRVPVRDSWILENLNSPADWERFTTRERLFITTRERR